jgi:hypothetical protein
MGQSRGELPLFLLINRGRETKRVGGQKFLEEEKTAENRGGGPKKKKKNRDSERVGRKTETEREIIFF